MTIVFPNRVRAGKILASPGGRKYLASPIYRGGGLMAPGKTRSRQVGGVLPTLHRNVGFPAICSANSRTPPGPAGHPPHKCGGQDKRYIVRPHRRERRPLRSGGCDAHLPRRACGTAHAGHLDHCLVLLFYIVGIGGTARRPFPTDSIGDF